MNDYQERDGEELDNIRFVQLFSRHQRDIQAYIRTLVPSATDADDVMQETSIILWNKFAEYDKTKDFGRWGCGIARMVVLRLRRKTACDKHWFNEELLQLLSAERLNQQSSYWEARRDALRECVTALDTSQRRFLDLRYANNMTVEEVSHDAGRPLSTVYRVLAKIRASLAECVARKLEAANRI